jgi:peptidase E
MPNRRLLLLSNGSELIGEHPSEFVRRVHTEFLGTSVRRVLFVPFAAVVFSQDEYLARVRAHCGPLG